MSEEKVNEEKLAQPLTEEDLYLRQLTVKQKDLYIKAQKRTIHEQELHMNESRSGGKRDIQKKQFSATDQVLKALKEKNQGLRQQLEDARSREQSAKLSAKKPRQQVERLQAENQRLSHQIKAKDQAHIRPMNELLDQCRALEAENRRLSDGVRRQNASSMELWRERNSLKTKYGKLSVEYEKKCYFSEAQGKLTGDLRQERDGLRIRVETMEGGERSSQSDLLQMREKVKELHIQLDTIKEVNRELQSQLAQWALAYGRLDVKYGVLEKQARVAAQSFGQRSSFFTAQPSSSSVTIEEVISEVEAHGPNAHVT